MLVGATDGIGLELARVYLERGWRVGVMGRDGAKIDAASARLRAEFRDATLATETCDVTDATQLPVAFESLLQKLGQADLVVYVAGVLIDGDGTTSVFADDNAMLATNTVAATHLLGLAANYFMQARRGHLAAIGSIAGDRGRRRNPAYGASKAALHTYLEGLRNRLHPVGVRVSTIKPGFVRTRMLGERTAPGAISPWVAAQLIARGLDRGRESFYVPWWWGIMGLALRLVPRAVFKRLGPP
jgi:decaprenylphospho-beta-D-erythro-pentofuranosid-2-ulose 2-reductase